MPPGRGVFPRGPTRSSRPPWSRGSCPHGGVAPVTPGRGTAVPRPTAAPAGELSGYDSSTRTRCTAVLDQSPGARSSRIPYSPSTWRDGRRPCARPGTSAGRQTPRRTGSAGDRAEGRTGSPAPGPRPRPRRRTARPSAPPRAAPTAGTAHRAAPDAAPSCTRRPAPRPRELLPRPAREIAADAERPAHRHVEAEAQRHRTAVSWLGTSVTQADIARAGYTWPKPCWIPIRSAASVLSDVHAWSVRARMPEVDPAPATTARLDPQPRVVGAQPVEDAVQIAT